MATARTARTAAAAISKTERHIPKVAAKQLERSEKKCAPGGHDDAQHSGQGRSLRSLDAAR